MSLSSSFIDSRSKNTDCSDFFRSRFRLFIALSCLQWLMIDSKLIITFFLITVFVVIYDHFAHIERYFFLRYVRYLLQYLRSCARALSYINDICQMDHALHDTWIRDCVSDYDIGHDVVTSHCLISIWSCENRRLDHVRLSKRVVVE